MRKSLFDSLREYCDGDVYPFHMPGHKRNTESGALSSWNALDITEIDGFDNLHQAKGLLLEAEQRAAELYGADESFYLINGSTAGILSAVSAISGRANKLIIARNCHKAVYNAAFLNHMQLYYVYPKLISDYDIAGEVQVQAIQEKIEQIKEKDRIAGIVITSPTYDGVESDIEAIAELAHTYEIPLIVDQAHGAHFGLHPDYPENAVRQGADIVIHSVHKTLSAPTQTALLHRNGKLVDGEKLRRYLAIYQSSSPSYLLMAGIDEAVQIAREEGWRRLEELLQLRRKLQRAMEDCHYIRICPYTEPGKLVISVRNTSITGQQMYDILREQYHLQMEMAAGSYVVAILTMMDTEAGMERLTKALLEIDKGLQKETKEKGLQKETEDRGLRKETEDRELSEITGQAETVISMDEAYNSSTEKVELKKAEGRIAADFINLYPPGIPLVVPGEKITEQVIEITEKYRKNGYAVQGIEQGRIKVVSQ